MHSGDQPYITLAKGLGGWSQNITIFADFQDRINASIVGQWVRKTPKICWRNIGMVPCAKCRKRRCVKTCHKVLILRDQNMPRSMDRFQKLMVDKTCVLFYPTAIVLLTEFCIAICQTIHTWHTVQKSGGGHNLRPALHSDSDGPIVSNKSDLSTFVFISFYWFKQELTSCHIII